MSVMITIVTNDCNNNDDDDDDDGDDSNGDADNVSSSGSLRY